MGNTALDMVRFYFPDATDRDADYFLWERTAFPFASLAYVRKQLHDLRQRYLKGQTRFCEFCNDEPNEGRSTCSLHS